jgi:ferredoxin
MKRQSFILVFQDKNNNNDWSADSQEWKFADFDDDIDWQKQLQAKKDGSFWTTFETSNNETDNNTNSSSTPAVDDDMLAEAWINTLQSVSAEETEFIILEADRAEMARQMEEWNFPSEVIASSLGVAVDTSLETEDDVVGMDEFRKKSFIEDIDLQAVESHETVEKDPETGEPIRTQMVYVDEHTCIGCTNCAMIAQSTFYMNQEHGRARVFQQWGDDDETIQIAIETCPVDCIHYVPFEELAKLEIERRDQNLNPKARLVSQGEMGSTQSHRVGGAVAFTPAQQISGNMGTRCNNCPSRGCKSCPMYGVGLNPDFLKKEQERKDRIAKKRLQELRESQQKTAEL